MDADQTIAERKADSKEKVMSIIEEKVCIPLFMKKIQHYLDRENIFLEPNFMQSLHKVDSSIFKSMIETQIIKVVTRKESSFTHLSAASISKIYPIENIYILLYIVKNFSTDTNKVTKDLNCYTELLKKKIHLHICDQSYDEVLMESAYLSLVSNICIFMTKQKIDISKIDTLLPINKSKITGTKKSSTGTFLGITGKKYFKGKYNPNSVQEITPIEELQTKSKNYLKGEIDEIIILKCPICGIKHELYYFNIENIFNFSSNIITFSCNHRNTTHTYESKSYSFTTPVELVKSYTRIEICMFIVNNKKYYDL